MNRYAMGDLAEAIAFASSLVTRFVDDRGKDGRGKISFPSRSQFDHVVDRLQKMKALLEEVGLPVTAIWVRRAIECIKNYVKETNGSFVIQDDEGSTLHSSLVQVINGLGTEMETKVFLSLPSDKAAWFEPNQPLFQQAVIDKFTDYLHEMFEAGNCYALGRATAAVFHTQRLMEVGLKAFGAKLGANFGPDDNWGSVLGAIEKELKKLSSNDPSTIQYRLIHSNLNSVRIALRNRVMHPKDTYTESEALRAIQATDAFLSELAAVI